MAIRTVPINKIQQGRLWVIYGRSNTGKDVVASSFPKPLLYIPLGDDGRNSIKRVEGIRTVPKPVNTFSALKKLLEECKEDDKFNTVVVSTFSFFTEEWKSDKVTSKGKKMTQQLWGDLLADTAEILRLCTDIAETKDVVLICHETMDDHIEDMEGEISPNIRPNVTRGARPMLEGLANFGIHCAKFSKEGEDKDGNSTVQVKYGCHIGPNPYYWTKVQCDKSQKIPTRIINPTYNKIMKIVGELDE